MELQPDEIVLTGNWIVEGGSVIADDVCRRIETLVDSQLERLGTDSSGWDTLYRDPRDGRLWKHIYPQSHCMEAGRLNSKLSRRKGRLQSIALAPPNNSFNRSANSTAFIENLDGFEVVCAPG